MGTLIAAMATGEHMFVKYTGGRSVPSQEEIARLAYELYVKRGRVNGFAVDDWLAAERQLTHHYR
jgi:hypothetical protein